MIHSFLIFHLSMLSRITNKVPPTKASTRASKKTAETAVARTTPEIVNNNVKKTTLMEVSVAATKTNKFNTLLVKSDPQLPLRLQSQALLTRFLHLQPVMLPLQLTLSPTSSTALLSPF
jgi:hypothetical protein